MVDVDHFLKKKSLRKNVFQAFFVFIHFESVFVVLIGLLYTDLHLLAVEILHHVHLVVEGAKRLP